MEDGVSNPVKVYNLQGEYMGRWDSTEQAAEETGTDGRHIRSILLGKERRFTANNMYWFLADEPEEKIFQKILAIQQTKYQGNRKNKV